MKQKKDVGIYERRRHFSVKVIINEVCLSNLKKVQ